MNFAYSTRVVDQLATCIGVQGDAVLVGETSPLVLQELVSAFVAGSLRWVSVMRDIMRLVV